MKGYLIYFKLPYCTEENFTPEERIIIFALDKNQALETFYTTFNDNSRLEIISVEEITY